MKKFNNNTIKKIIRNVSFVSFISLNPLVGCLNEKTTQYEKNIINEKGVIITQKTINLNEFKESSNKPIYMQKFAQENTFNNCKFFLQEMLKDSSIIPSDKLRALAEIAAIYRNETLDFSLNILKDKKYLNQKNISKEEEKNLIVLSNLLAFSSVYLKKYADYISQTSSITSIYKKSSEHPLGVCFTNALVERSYVTDVDEALNLSSEFLQKGSLYISVLATVAILKIDSKKGAKIIEKEIKNTFNPLKKQILNEIMKIGLEAEKKKRLKESVFLKD